MLVLALDFLTICAGFSWFATNDGNLLRSMDRADFFSASR